MRHFASGFHWLLFFSAMFGSSNQTTNQLKALRMTSLKQMRNCFRFKNLYLSEENADFTILVFMF